MKKLVAIGGVVVVLLIAIIVLTQMSNKEKLASDDNPYGDKKLQQPTIDLLKDENYQHITLPEDLKAKIDSGEEVNAYFFSPTCTHCRALTPNLMPILDELGIEVNQINLLEYDEWDNYGITATPTFIHFDGGAEVNRFEGNLPEEDLRAFLAPYAKK
ncbi:MAG TPA: thioredoxin family protein [Metalysinibacillus jejuensis]|uniref:Thioredoxin family protein n=1 Tax=Metalysinibacillus jejuensis TaxID=914327 RepID=A0A921NB63_9BACL|nr:thioredoxin family protein [Metalysinibacillus jejuensis]HJH10650.1 thioredoxin family protein [Metalysinibacillus jejuensis]